MASPVAEHARFHQADPDALVAASFACRFCLRTAPAIDVVEDDLGATARCYCLACRSSGEVLLDHEQLLRLVLRPPPEIHVSLRSSR